MKKILFAIPALALVLTACGSTTGYDDYDDDYAEEQYVPICIDPETEERLPDDYCDASQDTDNDGSFLMGALLVYMLMSDHPKVGKRAHDYKTKKPSGVLAKPSKNGYKAPKVSKPKSNGGSGYKPKSSGGGFKSGGGSSSRSGRR